MKKRTHYAGLVNTEHIGQEVVLMGWAHRRRDHGGVIFVDLRDREGIVQIVFNPEVSPVAHQEAHRIRNEYVLAVKGKVARRPLGMENPDLKSGEVEVMVEELEILNEAKTPPFPLNEWTELSEAVRLKYRYLDLRRAEMQRNLFLRSKVAAAVREYLGKEGFIEVETPFLTKSTPEGARDYLVPSRINKGMFYALPQSPQLFKQLLMIAGFDRYYQIVRCFRDEDLRADRQPEFTQIDAEMSFVDEDEVMGVMEGLIAHVFTTCLDYKLSLPFPRISYQEALSRFGRDNPDMRFSLELIDLTDILRDSEFRLFREPLAQGGVVKAIKVDDARDLSRKDMEEMKDVVIPYGAKGLAWARVSTEGWTSPIYKFLRPEEVERINERVAAREGNVLFFLADTPAVVHAALGNLRLHLAKRLNRKREDFSFVWVTDFPLFEYSETEKRFVATHHPFTSPHPEDIPYILEEPSRVRARAYDLVLNGTEIGGGSIRIHQKDVQALIFKALGIGEDEAREKFGFLLEALEYGAPPHGGIAFGLDRLVAIMAGAESIREVIAFPKTQKATCLLTDAPSAVSKEQLLELSLKILS